MIGPLTYLDAALLAVCFISALLAMYRGLTRELMSILSWVAAAAATLFFVKNYKDLATDMATQLGTPVAVAQIVTVRSLPHRSDRGAPSSRRACRMPCTTAGLACGPGARLHLRRRPRLPARRYSLYVLCLLHS